MQVSIRRVDAEEDDVKVVVKRRRQTLPELLSSVKEAFNIPRTTRIFLLDSIEDAANIEGDEELTLVVGVRSICAETFLSPSHFFIFSLQCLDNI
jgi:hypothetical protein